MPMDRETLRLRLLESFREEADERLRVLGDGLAAWRQGEVLAGSVESLFREVHSLKGAARAGGVPDIERLCHAWETLFAALKSGRLAITPPLVELARKALQSAQRLRAGEPLAGAELTGLCRTLEAAAEGRPPELSEPATNTGAPAPDPAPGVETHTVRVTARRLDNLLYLGETLIQTKLEAQIHSTALRDLRRSFEGLRPRRQAAQQASRYLRGDGEALSGPAREAVRALLDYVDWSLDYLDHNHFQCAQQERAGNHFSATLSQVSEAMQQELQSVLLLSCQTLVEGLPALAQDLATQTGKRIQLVLNGEALQIDKRILDELRTAMLHLVRNAIDHGIETPEVRLAVGKPLEGRLRIEFLQESGERFELRISDDGAGIDPERLKAKAIEVGLLSAAEADSLAEDEALRLAFASGLSTSPIITDLSGRGLGLPIVQELVERVGGRVELESFVGQGSRFSLHLPLSLSTFRAVILREAERIYALPALCVERCLRLPGTALKRQENRATVAVAGEVLPVWALSEILGLPGAGQLSDGPLTILLLRVRGERIALLVEELLGDQEITVKSMGKQLVRVKNLFGATILGDGRLVPILHPQDLYRSALATSGLALGPESLAESEQGQRRVLVAEDSFTSRGLLKSILESAGYEVATANDGLDAWTALKQGRFDVLVSDVEMPRMDGFVLTERIRADRELKDLPVVLVTALHSAEDRARGLEAGADAYLAKSGFDQDSLLDALRRLA